MTSDTVLNASDSLLRLRSTNVERLEFEKKCLEDKLVKTLADFQSVNKNYYEMYKSREEWRQYATQFKETCSRHLEELSRRELMESELVGSVCKLTENVKQYEKKCRQLTSEYNIVCVKNERLKVEKQNLKTRLKILISGFPSTDCVIQTLSNANLKKLSSSTNTPDALGAQGCSTTTVQFLASPLIRDFADNKINEVAEKSIEEVAIKEKKIKDPLKESVEDILKQRPINKEDQCEGIEKIVVNLKVLLKNDQTNKNQKNPTHFFVKEPWDFIRSVDSVNNNKFDYLKEEFKYLPDSTDINNGFDVNEFDDPTKEVINVAELIQTGNALCLTRQPNGIETPSSNSEYLLPLNEKLDCVSDDLLQSFPSILLSASSSRKRKHVTWAPDF